MIKAKKRYGQNFLNDDYVLDIIIESIPKNDFSIVEIGAGLGDLTKSLMTLGKELRSFEIDKDLIKHLYLLFNKEIKDKKLELINADVLDVWNDCLIDKDYNLVANLPYYIGTHIVLKALNDYRCKNILVMLQKEVVDRFLAKSATSSYNGLSVLIQYMSKVTKIMDVRAESFNPSPKVLSTIVLLEKYDGIKRDEDLESLLRVSFKNPRKKLIKNLSLNYDRFYLAKTFKSIRINELKRPGEITLEEFIQIKEMLNKRNKDER